MCEAEAIVNSCPLAVNHLADSDSPEPLSKNEVQRPPIATRHAHPQTLETCTTPRQRILVPLAQRVPT